VRLAIITDNQPFITHEIKGYGSVMMKQRIIDYHIARLRDKRPDVRLKAIDQLMKLEALEALEALRDVYQSDADEGVRFAAQMAGREIFRISRANNRQ
jgi:hypothetical protein